MWSKKIHRNSCKIGNASISLKQRTLSGLDFHGCLGSSSWIELGPMVQSTLLTPWVRMCLFKLIEGFKSQNFQVEAHELLKFQITSD